MNIRIASNFAVKNIRANKLFIIPFILSSSLMISLLYIMFSLLQNEFVKTRHTSLPMLINFGCIIISIFTYIFIIYANRFLVKRRNREFALYGILGLEKKHIKRIISIEQFINFLFISTISILGGYLIGKLMFMFLNKLMADMSANLMDYPFSGFALVLTMIFIFVIYVSIYIINVLNIKNVSPIELIAKQHKGEGEPKSKLILTILGLLALGYGYYLALTIEGTLKSLGLFFVASLFVIVGTYFLFISFSIIVLKIMKNNKKYFYKDKNFLSVSGMLYRMKANAVGLASITVLCTGVIITLSATISIYRSIDKAANNVIPREYSIISNEYVDYKTNPQKIELYKKELKKIADTSISGSEKIKNPYMSEQVFTYVSKEGNRFTYPKMATGKISDTGKAIDIGCYAIIEPIDSYNSVSRKNISIKENEILLTSNVKRLLKDDKIIFGDKEYRVRKVEDDIPGNIGVETFRIVTPTRKVFLDATNYYKTRDRKGNEYPSKISIEYGWNIKNKGSNYDAKLKKITEDKNIALEVRNDYKKFIYEMNGGFLFLGIVIGMVFLTGTILISYYKQVSEGFEDRKQFQIMRKVGLPDKLVRKTSSSQIVWMFITPLIVAFIHSMVASKIVYQLLGLFGIREYSVFIANNVMVLAVFIIVYLIIYKITSNIYYKIVR